MILDHFLLHSKFKKYIVIAILSFLPLKAMACSFITGLFTSEEVSIEYVGNIELKDSKTENGVTIIPISFTGGEWLHNSAITFKKIKSKVKNNEIHITVITCLASGGSSSHPKMEIKLKSISPGVYKVIYINPNGTSVSLEEIKI